jgi:hypothetical protein
MHDVSFVVLTLKWRLTKRSAAQLETVCDLMTLISVDNLQKYECGSYLAIFPAFAIFPSSTLLGQTS